MGSIEPMGDASIVRRHLGPSRRSMSGCHREEGTSGKPHANRASGITSRVPKFLRSQQAILSDRLPHDYRRRQSRANAAVLSRSPRFFVRQYGEPHTILPGSTRRGLLEFRPRSTGQRPRYFRIRTRTRGRALQAAKSYIRQEKRPTAAPL